MIEFYLCHVLICLKTLNQITIKNIVQNTYTFLYFLEGTIFTIMIIFIEYILYIMHALSASKKSLNKYMPPPPHRLSIDTTELASPTHCIGGRRCDPQCPLKHILHH